MKKLLLLILITLPLSLFCQGTYFYSHKFKIMEYDKHLENWFQIVEKESYSEFNFPKYGNCISLKMTDVALTRYCMIEDVSDAKNKMFRVKSSAGNEFIFLINPDILSFLWNDNGTMYSTAYFIYSSKEY